MKLTAVEWLVKQLNINGTVIPMEIECKANKLFENQIKDANEEGFHSGQSMAHNGKSQFESAKDYYNKTFKQQQ